MTDKNLYFLPSKGVKVPVRLNLFKHGGGIYLAFEGEGVHLPLLASAEVVAAELRQALAMVEAAIATNDQGHISRKQEAPARKPEMRDLTGDPRKDFPLFVRRFARSSPDVVAAVAQLYKQQGYKFRGLDVILQAFDDLETVSAIRGQLINNQGELLYGARNKIAKTLGIRDAGNYRARIDALAWLLKSTTGAELEDFEPLLEDSGVELEDFGVELEDRQPESAVSNTPRKWQKAANE